MAFSLTNSFKSMPNDNNSPQTYDSHTVWPNI